MKFYSVSLLLCLFFVLIDTVPVPQLDDRIDLKATLHEAAANGDIKEIRERIDKCENVNARDNSGKTALHHAAKHGHLEIVKLLVEHGAEVDVTDNFDDTPLHLSAKNGSCYCIGRDDVVEFLVSTRDADVNASNSVGETPTHNSAKNGFEKIVEFLLQSGARASIDVTDNGGNTPLHLAARNGHDKVVALLILRGANVNVKNHLGWTPLHKAALSGHEKIVQSLLKNGAHIRTANQDGDAAIHISSARGHEKVVRLLIKSGAIVERRNKLNKTPLFLAAENGFENVVDLLLQKGAKIDVQDLNQNSPLHFAARYGFFKIVGLLIDRGAKTEIPNSQGFSPIHIAAFNGTRNLMELLTKDSPASINMQDKNESTPLHLAALDGNSDVVSFLLEKGAIVDVPNRNGSTALDFAALNGHLDIVEQLVNNSADVNAQNFRGLAPLHFASSRGHVNVIEYLVNKSANVNMTSNLGQTPIFWAAWKGRDKAVEMLIAKGADVNHRDNLERLPLHMGAEGNRRVVELLLNNTSDVNAIDTYGRSALHFASYPSGHVDVIEDLITAGADFNIRNKYGYTPLLLSTTANQLGCAKCIKLLVNKGADVNVKGNDGRTPLIITAGYGDVTILEFLAKKGADVNASANDGWTAIHLASHLGREQHVESLLNLGANINVTNSVGQTPLYLATRSGKEKVVKILLERGADPNINGKYLLSLLIVALNKERERIAEILLANGVNTNVTDKGGGKTPLHIAARKGYKNVVATLVKNGADVNEADEDGRTPLHMVALNRKENGEIAKFLLKKHANVNARTKDDGSTPLFFAAENGNAKLVELLLENGADLNIRGWTDLTPLEIAKKQGKPEVVDIITKHSEQGAQSRILLSVLITSVILILCIMLFFLFLRCQNKQIVRHSRVAERESKNTTPELPLYLEKYQFPEDQIKLGSRIGVGTFGFVFKGQALGIVPDESKTDVSVKMVKGMNNNGVRLYECDEEKLKALGSELKILMQTGRHVNLVNLLGIVTDNIEKRELMVITEYCRFGNLRNYLKKHRKDFIDQIDPDKGVIDPKVGEKPENLIEKKNSCNIRLKSLRKNVTKKFNENFSETESVQNGTHNLGFMPDNRVETPITKNELSSNGTEALVVTTSDLLLWSFQIANGMQYLASHKVVHGDLAARNIYLCEDRSCEDNILKIGDLGLAQSLFKTDAYLKKKQGQLSYKWLAVESMRNAVFSTYSDVWSFGIVMWELFSLAQIPFSDIENKLLLQQIIDGRRLEKPTYATQVIYDVMRSCWRLIPGSRPTFDELVRILSKEIGQGVANRYIALNEPYEKWNEMNVKWITDNTDGVSDSKITAQFIEDQLYFTKA